MTLDFPRLGRIVAERRRQLAMSQVQVQANGGPSDTLIGAIENATWRPSDRGVSGTLRKLDQGLRWKPGSARRVLEGGDPEPDNGNGNADLRPPSAIDVSALSDRDRRYLIRLYNEMREAEREAEREAHNRESDMMTRPNGPSG